MYAQRDMREHMNLYTVRCQDVHVCTQTPLSTCMCALKLAMVRVQTHTATSGHACVLRREHSRAHTLRHVRARVSEHTQNTHVYPDTRPGQPPVPSCGADTAVSHVGATGHPPCAPRARAMLPPVTPSAPSEHRQHVGWQKIISVPAWPRESGNKKLPSSQPIPKALDTCVLASEGFLSSSHGKGNSPSLLITHDRSCACLQ